MKQKVVQLGKVRDLMSEWERVRQAILMGEVDGFHTALRRGEREIIFMGGLYKEHPQEAARVVLKASISRMLAEDPPLPALRAVGT